jgi:hypothetical protein
MKKKVPKNTPPEGVDDTFADRFGQVLMSKGLNFFDVKMKKKSTQKHPP